MVAHYFSPWAKALVRLFVVVFSLTVLGCVSAVEQGRLAYNRGDTDTALSFWQKEAQTGDANAQYYLGAYWQQRGDDDAYLAEAVSWYELAANQGHVYGMLGASAGQFNLGNESVGLYWLRQAARWGNADARRVLAETGQDVPPTDLLDRKIAEDLAARQRTEDIIVGLVGAAVIGYSQGYSSYQPPRRTRYSYNESEKERDEKDNVRPMSAWDNVLRNPPRLKPGESLSAYYERDRQKEERPRRNRCMDGSYVYGTCQQAPDGTYVDDRPQLAPDGTYVGGRPRLAPDRTYVGSDSGDITLCPDGSYVGGTRCMLAPDRTYIGAD